MIYSLSEKTYQKINTIFWTYLFSIASLAIFDCDIKKSDLRILSWKWNELQLTKSILDNNHLYVRLEDLKNFPDYFNLLNNSMFQAFIVLIMQLRSIFDKDNEFRKFLLSKKIPCIYFLWILRNISAHDGIDFRIQFPDNFWEKWGSNVFTYSIWEWQISLTKTDEWRNLSREELPEYEFINDIMTFIESVPRNK